MTRFKILKFIDRDFLPPCLEVSLGGTACNRLALRWNCLARSRCGAWNNCSDSVIINKDVPALELKACKINEREYGKESMINEKVKAVK